MCEKNLPFPDESVLLSDIIRSLFVQKEYAVKSQVQEVKQAESASRMVSVEQGLLQNSPEQNAAGGILTLQGGRFLDPEEHAEDRSIWLLLGWKAENTRR